MNYFIHDERDLSPAYVRKCQKFIHSLRHKGLIKKRDANTLFKLQAREDIIYEENERLLDRSSKRPETGTIKR